MAFRSSNPIIHDGKTFDLVGVALVTNPSFSENTVEANIVLNLFYYRYNGAGEIERPMIWVDTEEGKKLIIDPASTRTEIITEAYSKAANNPALAEALYSVGSGVQKFIYAKGL